MRDLLSHLVLRMAGLANTSGEEIPIAKLNLADARRNRQLNTFHQVPRHCCPSVYRRVLDAGDQG